MTLTGMCLMGPTYVSQDLLSPLLEHFLKSLVKTGDATHRPRIREAYYLHNEALERATSQAPGDDPNMARE